MSVIATMRSLFGIPAGETMINPDFYEIIERGARNRLYQVVFTNGHFVDDIAVDRFASCNVREVMISLHGLEETHVALAKNRSAYKKAMAAIERCVSNDIDVVVESILVKESIADLTAIVDQLAAAGVKEWRIMRYVPTGRNDQHYEVSMDETYPVMKLLDEYISNLGIDMNIGWPCSQNFCTTAEKKALKQTDPTIPLRRKQIVNHCEAGVAWCSVSFDGKLRTCPHSNRYFGDAAR